MRTTTDRQTNRGVDDPIRGMPIRPVNAKRWQEAAVMIFRSPYPDVAIPDAAR